MKALVLAAAATLLFGATAYADTQETDQAAAMSQAAAPQPHINPLWADNPTALPSYLMGRDGLMTNGLLPAPGWQG